MVHRQVVGCGGSVSEHCLGRCVAFGVSLHPQSSLEKCPSTRGVGSGAALPLISWRLMTYALGTPH